MEWWIEWWILHNVLVTRWSMFKLRWRWCCLVVLPPAVDQIIVFASFSPNFSPHFPAFRSVIRLASNDDDDRLDDRTMDRPTTAADQSPARPRPTPATATTSAATITITQMFRVHERPPSRTTKTAISCTNLATSWLIDVREIYNNYVNTLIVVDY